jgi:hypothetical protein
MNASRGCEYLKTLAIGRCKPDQNVAALSGETLKGQKPQGRRCLIVSGLFWTLRLQETVISKQRLGAWVSSEEEPKLMGESWDTLSMFPGNLDRENPEAKRAKANGMRGASKQY